MQKQKCKDLRGWKLEEALGFLRELQPKIQEAGFGLAILGSVLFMGESEKDLDMGVFPLNASKYDLGELRAALEKAGMKQIFKHYEIQSFWARQGSTDCKMVEVWSYYGQRIDVFYFR